MQKKLFVFLTALVFLSAGVFSPVNASFFDDAKKKVGEMWMDFEAALPFVPKSPKTVIYKMVKEMDKPKTAVLKMDMGANFKMQESPMEISVVMEAEGMPLNVKDKDKSEDAKIELAGDLKVQGMTISGKMDMIVKNEDSYIKIVEAPNLGLFDLSSMKGKWYKLPSEKPKTKNQKQKTNEEVEKLLKQEAEKLMDKAKKLADEKIEGEDTYTISAVITRQDFARIMKGVREMNQMLEGTESMGDITVTLNIYKKNWYFARAAFNTTMQVEMPANPLSATPLRQGFAGHGKTDVDLKMSVIFKNYDVPVVIEAPADFEEFEPTSLMGDTSASSSAVASPSGALK